MKHIEQIEKRLPPKRKALLHRLRAEGWEVVRIEDGESDWADDDTWLVESIRENSGAALTLWMFKFDGVHDGMDRVVAAPHGASKPDSPYGGSPSIDFDARRFEQQLEVFMSSLHEFRIAGTLGAQGSENDRKA